MNRIHLPLAPTAAVLACAAVLSPRAGADPAGPADSNSLQTVVVTGTRASDRTVATSLRRSMC